MHIGVLGPLRAGDRDDLARRDRVVLGMLVVEHPGEVSTDRVRDVLWPDGPPPSSTKVVQGCVARLRALLGADAIVTTDRGYRLDGVATLDVAEFERGIERGRELLALDQPDRAAFVLAEALALWRGPPYADLEDWDAACIESARLGELHRQAEELQVDALLARGDHAGALLRARALVAAEPLRERRWVQQALAEHRAGHRSDALATLRRCRARVREELGLDAGSELDRLEQAILHADPRLEVPAVRPVSTRCPWPGLAAYDAEDAESFFGREAELVSALAMLRGRQVLVVVGPSGIGKSSFVRAGVAASLRREGRDVAVVTPAEPLPHRSDVLVVDQAEELFARDPDAVRAYAQELADHARSHPLVLSLRADRMPDVATVPELARLVEQGLFLLGRLEEPGLRAAIEKPAARSGLRVEPGLVDLLLRDLAEEPGALPLLSHALVATWERREGATLTVAGYQASGGVRGAVSQSAEEVYAALGPHDRGVLRALMMRLVTPGPEGEPLRARVPRALVVADPAADGIVQRLVASRLLTSDDVEVTLAHEALARAWPRLRDWLDDDVEGRRTLHHLSGSAAAWDALGRPRSELYRGVRLARALAWADRRTVRLAPVEEAFLAAARERAEEKERSAAREAARQRAINRRLRILAAALGVVVVAALAAGGVALGQSRRASTAAGAAADRARAADARALGARALLTDDPALALLLGVAGARLDPSPDTRANLAAVLAKRPRLIGVATLPTRTPTSRIVADAGEQFLYVSDRSHHVYQVRPETMTVVRDVQAGAGELDRWETIPVTAPRHATMVLGVAAAQRDRRPVRLLDYATLAESERQLGGWPRRRVGVSGMAVDATGRTLAATMATAHIESSTVGWIDGGWTLVWDLRAPDRPVARIRTPENFYNGVALSGDGRTVFVTNPLTAYDVRSGRRLWRDGASDWTIPLAVSPDDRLLAKPLPGNGDNLALYAARTGRLVRTLRGHTGPVTDVAFSPDGAWVAAAAGDGLALVWDVRTGEVARRVEVGVEQVTGLTFRRGSTTLFTVTSGPSQVQAWDLAGYDSFVTGLPVPDPVSVSGSSMMRISHDGTMAMTMTDGGDRMAVVDTGAASRAVTRRFDVAAHRAWTGAGGWSADDASYAVGLGRGLVQVFDVATGEVAALRSSVVPGTVAEVAYSRNGEHLVVAGVDGTVERVDPGTLRPTGRSVRVPGEIYAMTASPDGRTAFVAAGETGGQVYWLERIRRWFLVDLVHGRVLRHGDLGLDSAVATDFSPDGRHVAVGGRGGEVEIVDASTGRAVAPPTVGHDGDAMWVAFDATGRRLTSGSAGDDVALWDGRTGALLGRAAVPNPAGLAVSGFRSDGSLLVASADGWMGVWDPDVQRAIGFACRVAGRDLTEAEWSAVVPDRPWRRTCPARV